MVELVRAVSEQVVTSLPGFWKIAKEYIQGKFQKVNIQLISAGYIDPPRSTDRPRHPPDEVLINAMQWRLR